MTITLVLFLSAAFAFAAIYAIHDRDDESALARGFIALMLLATGIWEMVS